MVLISSGEGNENCLYKQSWKLTTMIGNKKGNVSSVRPLSGEICYVANLYLLLCWQYDTYWNPEYRVGIKTKRYHNMVWLCYWNCFFSLFNCSTCKPLYLSCCVFNHANFDGKRVDCDKVRIKSFLLLQLKWL